MSEIAEIVDELRKIHEGDAWHGAALLESLAGVSPVQAAARIAQNTHSIWEIVLHITGWEDVFRRRLEGQQTREPEEGDFPGIGEVSEEAWTRTLSRLNSGHERLVGVVSGFSGSILKTNVPGSDYSVRFLVREIVRHHVYHAGQIAFLRKSFSETKLGS